MRRPSLMFWLILVLIAAVALFPYLWIVLTSFKARSDILTTPPVWIHDPNWINYQSMLFGRGFDKYLLNSAIIGISSTLLALTVGPTSDFADAARTRGLKAARLKLAKSFIVAHSHRRDISISTVAASLNVTPRYVQRLFEAEGTTFSEFLIGQRLTRAHRLLCEPNSSHTAISTIAYDVGFGDLSYFNRRFRRQYGNTPREVRGEKAE